MVNLPHIISMHTDTNETIHIIAYNNMIHIHNGSNAISLNIHDSKRLKRKLNDCIKFCEINKELSE